jgi:phosphate starvation-inducible PhoH-like protein
LSQTSFIASSTPPASGGKAVTLQFSDNTLLPLLLGDHDRHLVRIEQAMGVRLSCRGNRVAIAGDAGRVDAAQSMLQGLWRRLERGDSVGRPEVDAAIRLAEADVDPRLPLSDVPAIRTRRGAVAARSAGQAAYMEALAGHDMVFGVGPAGTGKTYLAVATAVSFLRRGRIKKIVLVRPAVEAGEHLGFLPGDLEAKINPYLRPLLDALHDLMDYDQIRRYIDNDLIEIAPLAYMRGRTLNDAAIILDEGQNATVPQMKMFLTRMGQNARIVVTGDVTQVDLPAGTRSGLADAIERLKEIPGIGTTFLDRSDIVRHPLVQAIVDCYESTEAAAERDGRVEPVAAEPLVNPLTPKSPRSEGEAASLGSTVALS